MTTGVTIGEISTPITARRAGMAALARPSDATVPSTVATVVAKKPMSRLFSNARSQAGSPVTEAYQRKENAAGSRDNMPSVKVK